MRVHVLRLLAATALAWGLPCGPGARWQRPARDGLPRARREASEPCALME